MSADSFCISASAERASGSLSNIILAVSPSELGVVEVVMAKVTVVFLPVVTTETISPSLTPSSAIRTSSPVLKVLAASRLKAVGDTVKYGFKLPWEDICFSSARPTSAAVPKDAVADAFPDMDTSTSLYPDPAFVMVIPAIDPFSITASAVAPEPPGKLGLYFT